MQKYYQNENRFNGVYSRDNLKEKITDVAYVINLNEYSSTGTYWIALYSLNNNAIYFDRFGVEHIPKEIKKIINKSIIVTNTFRIQTYDLIMCEYFCIRFFHFMLAGKTLTDITNLFWPNSFEKNNDIIINYFMTNV